MQLHSRSYGLEILRDRGVKMGGKWEQTSGLLGCLNNFLKKPILDMMGIIFKKRWKIHLLLSSLYSRENNTRSDTGRNSRVSNFSLSLFECMSENFWLKNKMG